MEGFQTFEAAVAALADWWVDAGVDTSVGDDPRNWLRPLSQPGAASETAPVPTSPAAASLSAIRDELAAVVLPGVSPTARRVMPQGAEGAPVLLVTDLPAPEDLDEGRLFAGACGTLLDAMLAAIGLKRADLYLLSLSPVRPASGRLDDKARAILLPLARRHLALTRAQRVLLLGDCATAMLLHADCSAARGRWHDLNHGEGTVPALATLHPRTLLAQPLLKAESWRDLRLLKKALA